MHDVFFFKNNSAFKTAGVEACLQWCRASKRSQSTWYENDIAPTRRTCKLLRNKTICRPVSASLSETVGGRRRVDCPDFIWICIRLTHRNQPPKYIKIRILKRMWGGKSRMKWILSIYKVNVVEVVNLLGGGSNKYMQENIDRHCDTIQ